MPLPQRDLLVHESDMTSTLQKHYAATIGLEVLRVGELNGLYTREVILTEEGAGKSIEYGVIEIDLAQFNPEQRELILAGKEPLGGILNRLKANYTSGPLGYFEVVAPEICREKFNMENSEKLFGRYNQLTGRDGVVFATIVEILPNGI